MSNFLILVDVSHEDLQHLTSLSAMGLEELHDSTFSLHSEHQNKANTIQHDCKKKLSYPPLIIYGGIKKQLHDKTMNIPARPTRYRISLYPKNRISHKQIN